MEQELQEAALSMLRKNPGMSRYYIAHRIAHERNIAQFTVGEALDKPGFNEHVERQGQLLYPK